MFRPVPVAVFLALATLSFAQPTPNPALLVLSKHDHALVIVDPANLQVVARVPVGNDPHEVIASSDGKTAYVSNYGFGAFHTLAVVDLIAQRPLPAIDLGALRGPHGLAFSHGKVWFTAEAAKAIGSYDPATRKVDWIMGTGQNRTHMLYVSPDARRILTSNVSSGTVTIMEKTEGHAGPPMGSPPGAMQQRPSGSGPSDQSPGLAPGMAPGPPRGLPPTPPGGDWQLTVVPVGHGSEGFDVSPDGKEAWVANAGDGTISIIDIAAEQVTATLAAHVPGANRLKFTPNGKMVLVSAGPDFVILDAATHQEIKRLKTGQGSGGVLVAPDGLRAYEACGPDNYVAVIDLKTLEVVGHISPGGEPDGMAWATQQ
jgi:YVTN family beta-propeller protein